MKAWTKPVAVALSLLLSVGQAWAQGSCWVPRIVFRIETKAIKYFLLDTWPEAITGLNGQQTTVQQCIIDGFMLWDGKKGVTIRPSPTFGGANVEVADTGPFERIRANWDDILVEFGILKRSVITFNSNLGETSGWAV